MTDRIDSGCVVAISGDRSDSHSQSTRIHFRLVFTVGASVAQRSADQIKHKHLPCLEYDMIVALLRWLERLPIAKGVGASARNRIYTIV